MNPQSDSTNNLPVWLAQSLGIALAVGLIALSAGAAPAAKPDLTGVVRTQAGQPITNASLFISTAGPRQGPGILCPSCYSDCRKSAKSGPAGEFKLAALDPELLFQILVVAPGNIPAFFNKVDPLKGPLDARLKPRTATNIPPSQTILGRVLNSDQEPLVGAVVSVSTTTTGNTTSSRPPKGTDPLAITDERGEFTLLSEGKFDAMNLQVEARGYAKANFPETRPGAQRRTFVVTVGATLTGRLVARGQPLPNVSVGVVGADRSMGNFTGDFVIGTMANGRFLFANLPPNRDYDVYGLISSLQPLGALPVRVVGVKGDGAETDLGELEIVPGRQLAGQVRLTDNQPLPPHTRLLIGRPEAWDTLTVELPPDGHFAVSNLPTETISVDTRVEGYRISERNVSLDRLNPFHLVGRLNTDKTNLLVLLEPGANLPPELSPTPQEERPEKLPLGGAEGPRHLANAVTFSGQVLDADTHAPLTEFRVTPGLQRNPSLKSWIEWYRTRVVDGVNGSFQLELAVKEGAIVLLAEAEGYLPAVSEPLTAGQAHCAIALKKGRGPQGRVLTPDGRPADGVTVCYLVAGEQASLDNQGAISVYRNRQGAETLTDPEGDFSFPPKLGPGELFATSARGFARTTTTELAAKGTLTLQPWGRVHGRLLKDGKPLAGENVDLNWRNGGGMERPWFNLHGTRTDDDGRFALEHVPPGELQLATRVPMGVGGGSGWTTEAQRTFTVKPGEDLDLGAVEKAVPKVAKRWFNF